MQKTIPFRGILALAATLLALQMQAQQKNRPARPKTPARVMSVSRINNHQYLNMDVDSTFSPPRITIYYKTDSFYNMVLSGDKLTSLSIDGRAIPTDSFFVYDGLVRQMLEQLKRDREQAERDRQQAERDREQEERDREQAGRDREQAEKDRQQAERDRQQSERDRQQGEQQALRDKFQAEKDARQALRDKQQAERDRQQADKDRLQADRDREQASRDREQAVRDRDQASRDRDQAERDRIQAEEDRKLLKSLMAAVVNDKLVPDEKSIQSLILDEYVFVINGNKQSEELLKKYKEKFIKAEGYRIRFQNKTMSIGRMDQ